APLTPPSTTSLQQLNLGHGPSPSSLTATMQEAALPSTSETNVHLNLGEKTTVKKAKSRVFLTNTEKYLQDKLVAASKNILPAECKDTADLLLFMDNIFDSVNGSRQKNRNAKPLLGPATPNSAHHQIWIEGVQIFKSMKFVSNGKNNRFPPLPIGCGH
ncbi:hypothetical protein HW555_009236, partial [Spodoptera exigua]